VLGEFHQKEKQERAQFLWGKVAWKGKYHEKREGHLEPTRLREGANGHRGLPYSGGLQGGFNISGRGRTYPKKKVCDTRERGNGTELFRDQGALSLVARIPDYGTKRQSERSLDVPPQNVTEESP